MNGRVNGGRQIVRPEPERFHGGQRVEVEVKFLPKRNGRGVITSFDPGSFQPVARGFSLGKRGRRIGRHERRA
jgi:hypothetical protein